MNIRKKNNNKLRNNNLLRKILQRKCPELGFRKNKIANKNSLKIINLEHGFRKNRIANKNLNRMNLELGL